MTRRIFAAAIAVIGLTASVAFGQRLPAAAPAAAPAPAPAPASPGSSDNPPTPDANTRGPDDDAMMVVTTGTAPSAPTTVAPELFPLASQLWLHSLDLSQAEHDSIERAIADQGPWVCTKAGGSCAAKARIGAGQGHDDSALVAMRQVLPWAATAITVWSPTDGLHYDPKLVGHAVLNPSRWIASKRIPAPRMASAPGPVPVPVLQPPSPAQLQCPLPPLPPPEGELQVVLRWPTPAEVGDFQYIAVADECSNVVVTRFAREIAMPVEVETSDSCNMNALSRGPLKLLRNGTTLRVSAFNVDRLPSRGNVVSATYRVDVPSLETATNGTRAPILVPDLSREDIRVDCSPSKARNEEKRPPPGPCPPLPKRAGRPLASESFVIDPEPLRSGRCRVVIDSPMLSRLNAAPLLLHVTVERVDLPAERQGRKLVDDRWLVTPGPGREFVIPHLRSVEGDARLVLTVSSDPADTGGSAVLFTDALRGVHAWQGADAAGFRRDLASASITTAALCGGWDFKTIDEIGSCLRAYVTFPVMLANFQITRAPWVEKPLLDPSVPGGIGAALAVDSYDPARQRAFPIAVLAGGAFQRLTDSKNGILTYLGIMPSLPVLGTGGTTTSIGVLLGAGVTYVIDSAGPNEGFKPAAFAAIVVGTGQFVLQGGASAPPP